MTKWGPGPDGPPGGNSSGRPRCHAESFGSANQPGPGAGCSFTSQNGAPAARGNLSCLAPNCRWRLLRSTPGREQELPTRRSSEKGVSPFSSVLVARRAMDGLGMTGEAACLPGTTAARPTVRRVHTRPADCSSCHCERSASAAWQSPVPRHGRPGVGGPRMTCWTGLPTTRRTVKRLRTRIGDGALRR